MDSISSFVLEGARFKGVYIGADQVVKEILACHSYPDIVQKILGQGVILSLALAQSIKYKGVFSFQVRSAGPVQSLFINVTHDKQVRAYAVYDVDKLPVEEDLTNQALFGNGELLFSVTQLGQEPYQGIVSLTGNTLTDTVLDYFRLSEQIKTDLILRQKDGMTRCLMLQQMPLKEGDDALEVASLYETADVLMNSVQDAELFSDKLAPEKLLYRLFHANDLVVYEPQVPVFSCACRKEQMKRFLERLPASEREELYQDGEIVAECQFCQSQYVFKHEDF